MTGRKVTIKDVAEAVGVSTALVSFALNGSGRKYRVSEEMARRIIAKAEELNYRPSTVAQSLRSGKTKTIGVILFDISNKFFADIARCIENEASNAGYTIIIGSSDDNVSKFEKLIDVFINKGVDGFIIVPCEGSEKLISKLLNTGIPVVLVDRTYNNLNVSSVTLDNMKATALAVQELFNQGFKKIRFISYITESSNIRERSEGYVAKMRELGLEKEVSVNEIDYSSKATILRELIPELLDNGAEAIIFSTNRLSIDGLVVIGENNRRVPDDVAIVAFDGSETFAFDLYYTTVSYIKQPIKKFGVESFAILRKLIAQGKEAATIKVTLNPELVALESSRKTK